MKSELKVNQFKKNTHHMECRYVKPYRGWAIFSFDQVLLKI